MGGRKRVEFWLIIVGRIGGGEGSKAVFLAGTDGRVEEELFWESISKVGSKSSNRLGT